MITLHSRRAAAVLFVLASASGAFARDIRVAVVTDGNAGRQVFSAASIEREIANVASPDTRILMPVEKRFAGDFSLDGAAAALDRALADRDVDVVLTLGILTSQQAARRSSSIRCCRHTRSSKGAAAGTTSPTSRTFRVSRTKYARSTRLSDSSA